MNNLYLLDLSVEKVMVSNAVRRSFINILNLISILVLTAMLIKILLVVDMVAVIILAVRNIGTVIPCFFAFWKKFDSILKSIHIIARYY